MSQEVLVLGGELSGKSIFIRRIVEIVENPIKWDPLQSTEGTFPTLGVELRNITLDNNKSFKFREVGSVLSSKWSSYLEECHLIIFLIDIADLGTVTSSMVLLHELLAHIYLSKGMRVLLCLNKTDLTDQSTTVQASNFLRLPELTRNGKVELISGSCLDGTLCSQALQWLKML